jgi:NitT/TauT family transport system ATP-binding protein
MSKIEARGIRKIYNPDTPQAVLAIDSLDIDIEEGEFVSLLGPSGCGKSTFLYMIGGFEQPTLGTLTLDTKPIRGPGADRGIVFQEYLLFPWQTVATNVAYGLRLAGVPKAERDKRVRELINIIGLTGFEDAYPETLSGGMKQRVAIARAIAYDPQILLMDEPFGALDAQTRSRMINDLIRIHKSTYKTTVFVTHSVEESILLSDRVLLFSSRPSRIKKEYKIDIPHPRSNTDPRFVEYERLILSDLNEELSKEDLPEATE